MDAIGAAGHAEPAPLPFMPRITSASFVFPIDIEEAHFVTLLRVWIAIVAMHSEQFVHVWKTFRPLRLALLLEKNIRFLPVDDREIERRLAPANAVITFGISDAHPRFVPDLELSLIPQHRPVNRGKRRLPFLGRPKHRVAFKLPRRLHRPMHPH